MQRDKYVLMMMMIKLQVSSRHHFTRLTGRSDIAAHKADIDHKDDSYMSAFNSFRRAFHLHFGCKYRF